MSPYVRIQVSSGHGSNAHDVVCRVNHYTAYAVLVLRDTPRRYYIGAWLRMESGAWDLETRTCTELVEL